MRLHIFGVHTQRAPKCFCGFLIFALQEEDAANLIQHDAVARVLSCAVGEAANGAFVVAVIEGMAAGLPILGSSACGSVQERVVEGVNGFIHTVGDSDRLAENMVSIATSKQLREEMQKNSLATSSHRGIDEAAQVVNSLLSEIQASDDSIPR